ncbi:MAG: phosphate signaling complex protein PhoU [Planctomycetia bacterium]|nr:phosphate signaling complex protein PhoU [Planctomycetia bacterium]
MTEQLFKRLDRLFLKLDHTGLLVEQALADALFSAATMNAESAQSVIDSDGIIDIREVETERECIRLLALYQPAAIDLRRICFVIKVNNDLERMADHCVSIAKFVQKLGEKNITLSSISSFRTLTESVTDALHQTMRLLAPPGETPETQEPFETDTPAVKLAKWIIRNDRTHVDVYFRQYLDEVFSSGNFSDSSGLNALYALTSIGRNLERIGDLCKNIAEDAIFLKTGEIVRHATEE